MKKLALFSAAIMMLACTFQSLAADTEDCKHFGVRAQYDMNTSTAHSDLFHFGPGVSVGFNYYSPIQSNFYFNTGLLFSYDTFGYKGEFSKRPFEGSINNTGMRLPVEIGYKFLQTNSMRLSVYTGALMYFNFKVQADYTEIYSTGPEIIKKDYTNGGADLGWTLGLGFDLLRNWHAHIQGTLGLTNWCQTDDQANGAAGNVYKRAEIAIGLGYNF